MRKKKLENFDGLGPKEKRKIKIALRQIWHRSHARKLCVKRAALPKDANGDEYSICEKCKRKVPKITVDHIERVGEVDNGIIERMFVPSARLRALCGKCHGVKTKTENAEARRKKKNVAKFTVTDEDF